MIKYWMTREGETSQAGPYGEPPLGSILSENTGFAVEFTLGQVEIYKALLGLTRAYKKLGGLDVAWDSELVKAEYAIENYGDMVEEFYE